MIAQSFGPARVSHRTKLAPPMPGSPGKEDSMNATQPTQVLRHILVCALMALVLALQGTASAQQDDVAEGMKLYVSQCKICHGSVSALDNAERVPVLPHWQLVRLAMQHGAGPTMTDAPMPIAPESNDGATLPGALAFAPPFGPHLRGVYGRVAGSVEGYEYSSTFLKTLKGMEWNEAALNVWITNSQAWVPGVYMFYKQPDPEVRRKIVLYLKESR
jgi:cytochrome c2